MPKCKCPFFYILLDLFVHQVWFIDPFADNINEYVNITEEGCSDFHIFDAYKQWAGYFRVSYLLSHGITVCLVTYIKDPWNSYLLHNVGSETFFYDVGLPWLVFEPRSSACKATVLPCTELLPRFFLRSKLSNTPHHKHILSP